MTRDHDELEAERQEIDAQMEELLERRKQNRIASLDLGNKRSLQAAKRLADAMPQCPHYVGLEGDKVVLRMDSTTANYLARSINNAKHEPATRQIDAVAVLRGLVQWWDADRTGDTLTYESAHQLGGLIGSSRSIVYLFDHAVSELEGE